METIIPVRTWSEANTRRHWAERARVVKKQRWAAYVCLVGLPEFRRMKKTGKLDICLTRVAPRSLDSDNLASALKGVRDGIADALGRDDGNDTLRWQYGQRRGLPKEYSVMVTIHAGIENVPTAGCEGDI